MMRTAVVRGALPPFGICRLFGTTLDDDAANGLSGRPGVCGRHGIRSAI
jgi:hypothetical protein